MSRTTAAILSSMLMGFVVAVSFSASIAPKDHEFRNEEYGIIARIPENLSMCIANTQGHVHGVGTVLAGKDCENPKDDPAFNMWADGNVGFEPDPLEALKGHSYCSGKAPEWAVREWSNAIDGLKTAVCRTEKPDGKIEIALAAQAGKWTDDSGREVPYINYQINFGTTKARYQADVKVLNTFLKSIRIDKSIAPYR